MRAQAATHIHRAARKRKGSWIAPAAQFHALLSFGNINRDRDAGGGDRRHGRLRDRGAADARR